MLKTKFLRGVAAWLILAACLAFLPSPITSAIRTSPIPSKRQETQKEPAKGPRVSEADIRKLILELGNEKYKVREAAMKRLTEIGVPALRALGEAEASANDLETRLRAKLLTKNIREANRLPTRVDGLEFALLVDPQWDFPNPGERKRVYIQLNITNTTQKSVCFSTKRTVKVVLKDAQGKQVPGGCQGNDSSLGTSPISKPLGPGDTLEVHLVGHLAFSAGLYCLFYKDCQGDSWAYRGMSQGVYQLSLTYENSEQPQHPLAKELCWIGRAETLSETVLIK